MKVIFLSVSSTAPVEGSGWLWCPWQLPNCGKGWPAVPAGVDGGNLPLQAPVAAAADLGTGYLEPFLFYGVVGESARTKPNTTVFMKSMF